MKALRLLLLLALAAWAASCRNEEPDAEETVRKAFEAIIRPGMVFHAKADDGSEVWIDAERQVYRRLAREGDVLLLSVGEGWVETLYDPFANRVLTKDRSPTGTTRPRIDDPAVRWLEPLGALAFGQTLTTIGSTTSDGRAVLALEVRTPIVENSVPTGRYLVGRVELDPETYLVVAFERRVEPAPGQREQPTGGQSLPGDISSQQPKRIRYELAEFIPRDDLPQDFFSKKSVEGQVVTLQEKIAQIRDMEITPYWLGERYDGGPGALSLPEDAESAVIDQAEGEASFHYALELPAVSLRTPDSVIIRLGRVGQAAFGQPVVQEFAGPLPEEQREAVARGATATVYVSILTPAALPCPGGNCPPTSAPLYHRLQTAIEGTAIQIETFARVDESGADQNGYNTQAGILALAEALLLTGDG